MEASVKIKDKTGDSSKSAEIVPCSEDQLEQICTLFLRAMAGIGWEKRGVLYCFEKMSKEETK